ncbi:acyl-coenzyme A diphosphatase FITM2 [Lonchura striata]|uniref:Fat storage-inducing transmembrane protein 2 n=1 Tax=Lonchura striata TaxID=40157 RepID=A0A218UEX1_9PASE|nr:fat storage-inducing transmembrane protein 2 [Lonchura striata domestica]XP_021396596.1 fat storage-inducing transmembrane protein 2 [Lonchura striata domestica]OWK52317.1 Fat storage-inducing transmembrane protein 2 [Lonchura striata domestica]OWK56395.1 Fat storage-inducing transmembrane protein 2 [Lonchura striata domestica]
MERLERAGRCLRAALARGRLRRRLPALLLAIALLGSALKDSGLVPDTPLRNKRNPLNVYFVKVAWAWTLWLLLPFITLTSYELARSKLLHGRTKSALLALRRLGALLVGTAVWYLCTELFILVENLTGECSLQAKPGQPARLYASKRECHQDSGVWNGFDISGHCFLLSYCAMMILEELAVLEALAMEHSSKLRAVINVLLVSLCFLTVIWVFMFLCTALYFHDFSQKLLGVLIGLSAWYGTYRFWYLKPFSPGLPLPNIPLSSKKYSYSR